MVPLYWRDMEQQALVELAGRQYGLFSRSQAMTHGATNAVIYRRLAAGRWLQLAPGVYSLPGCAPSWRRSLMLACLDAGPGATVSHEAAAALHGMTTFAPGPVVITVPHGDHQRPSEARVQQSTDLRPADRTVVDGLEVTTVARTLFDLAAVTRRARFERALDDAHAGRLCAIGEVQALFDELRRPGKRGMKLLGDVLAHRGPGYVPPASMLERRCSRSSWTAACLHLAANTPCLGAPMRRVVSTWLIRTAGSSSRGTGGAGIPGSTPSKRIGRATTRR